MRRVVLYCAVLAAVLLAGSVYAADTYYVQSVKAKVLSAPSFKSNVLGEASKGPS